MVNINSNTLSVVPYNPTTYNYKMSLSDVYYLQTTTANMFNPEVIKLGTSAFFLYGSTQLQYYGVNLFSTNFPDKVISIYCSSSFGPGGGGTIPPAIVSTTDNEIYCYGRYVAAIWNNYELQTTLPTDYEWTQVSCGYFTNSSSNMTFIALNSNGDLYGFGSGATGIFGQGVAGNLSSWTLLNTNVNKFSIVQLNSRTQSCAILVVKNDGTLWTAGTQSTYQGGINTVTQTNTFTQVGSATDWTDATFTPQCNQNTGGLVIAQKTDLSIWYWGAVNSTVSPLPGVTTGNKTVPTAYTTVTAPYHFKTIISCDPKGIMGLATNGEIYALGSGVTNVNGNATNNFTSWTKLTGIPSVNALSHLNGYQDQVFIECDGRIFIRMGTANTAFVRNDYAHTITTNYNFNPINMYCHYSNTFAPSTVDFQAFTNFNL